MPPIPRMPRLRRRAGSNGETATFGPSAAASEDMVDLERRRDQLRARVAEMQWDLGGLVYEMATRDHIKVEVIVRRAAALQEADAELAEVERILRTEQTGAAGSCGTCGAPHSSGAGYCWQCGMPLLEHVTPDALAANLTARA
jgi:tRNA A37 threonylcarbamoyltransferase TsaD